MKAALIEAATSIVGAEDGEISAFTRRMTVDGEQRRDLILYDNVAGGAGYVRKAAASNRVRASGRPRDAGWLPMREINVTSACARTATNSNISSSIRTLIQPYLDEVIVLNSTEEKNRLAPFGTGAQRYCGTNASSWLQKRWRTVADRCRRFFRRSTTKDPLRLQHGASSWRLTRRKTLSARWRSASPKSRSSRS